MRTLQEIYQTTKQQGFATMTISAEEHEHILNTFTSQEMGAMLFDKHQTLVKVNDVKVIVKCKQS